MEWGCAGCLGTGEEGTTTAKRHNKDDQRSHPVNQRESARLVAARVRSWATLLVSLRTCVEPLKTATAST
ncbi:hypothetical protein SLEP1_g35611 [Rubroshorea leprosula]|uniref:Uncharacterized protein n=1 Tax=Rubroshorea leprosula TaxID=152421 RepID=A0AAV5KNY3_9ROSI|nr:hypothetical protein SLEP1_g35611 [Rubroshorea leprosula]